MRLKRVPGSRANASEDRKCRAQLVELYREFSKGVEDAEVNKRSPMVGCRPLL